MKFYCFKHVVIYEKSQKNAIEEENLAELCSHIWHVDIPKYVHCLDTQSVKVRRRYLLPNTKIPLIFMIFFFQTYVNVFDLPKKETQKSGHIRIILDKVRYFSKFL